MSVIIAVDPGKNKLGLAILIDGKPALVETVIGLAPPGRETDRDGYRGAYYAAQEVGNRVAFALLNCYPNIDVVLVIERMQVDARTGGKEADLLDVSTTGGAVAMLLPYIIARLQPSLQIWSPTPMLWKKQLPKAVMQERLKKKYGIDKLGHDAWDALGIADWALDQLTLPPKARVFCDAGVDPCRL
jgi:hypothetical protein